MYNDVLKLPPGGNPATLLLIITPRLFAANTAYFFADQGATDPAELGLLFARRHTIFGDVCNDTSRGPLRNFCSIAIKRFAG